MTRCGPAHPDPAIRRSDSKHGRRSFTVCCGRACRGPGGKGSGGGGAGPVGPHGRRDRGGARPGIARHGRDAVIRIAAGRIGSAARAGAPWSGGRSAALPGAANAPGRAPGSGRSAARPGTAPRSISIHRRAGRGPAKRRAPLAGSAVAASGGRGRSAWGGGAFAWRLVRPDSLAATTVQRRPRPHLPPHRARSVRGNRIRTGRSARRPWRRRRSGACCPGSRPRP